MISFFLRIRFTIGYSMRCIQAIQFTEAVDQ